MPKYSIAFDLHEGNNAQSNYDDALDVIKKQAITPVSISKALRSHYIIQSGDGIQSLGNAIAGGFNRKGIYAFDLYISKVDGEYHVTNGTVSSPPFVSLNR